MVARLNQDVVVSILLLLFCGVMFHASGDIKITDFGTMPSNVWPRVVLAALAIFSALLLLRSLRAPAEEATGDAGAQETEGFFSRYRNAFFIYGLFFGFLLTLEVFGMLLGGVLFVFLCLTALGEITVRNLIIHLVVAVVAVGTMWAIFTFALQVLLPEGSLIAFN